MIIYNYICSDQYLDDMDKIIDIPTVKDYLMLHITSDTDIRSISVEPSKEWQAVRQMSIAVRLCNKKDLHYEERTESANEMLMLWVVIALCISLPLIIVFKQPLN